MAILQVRIDPKIKEEANKVYESLGLDLSTAVRLFLMKSIDENGLPFELKNKNGGKK